MEPIQGRLLNIMAIVDDQDTREMLAGTIALIKLNQRSIIALIEVHRTESTRSPT